MRGRLHGAHGRRRNAMDPLSRLHAARVAPDPVFRAALRERLLSTAPGPAPRAPVRASGPRRPHARRPRLVGGLVVALVLLCAHLAACMQPQGGRPVAPGGHGPPRHAEPGSDGPFSAEMRRGGPIAAAVR